MIAALWQALVSGAVRAAPARAAMTVLAIAIGVALGVAVHLINASATAEFDLATRQLTGTADLIVRGGRSGFDEVLYPRIARLSGIAATSPALEFDASLRDRRDTLKIIGLDALRAGALQPAAAASPPSAPALSRNDLFDPDAIRLSASAARALQVGVGDTLAFQVGMDTVTLHVRGILSDGAYRAPIGIIDIAAAQWRFARLGRLNRVDLRLLPDVDRDAFGKQLQAVLPAGVHVTTPQMDSDRGIALTRAYRLNLEMLAMIALFTGAFLVYTTQVLTLLRRRAHIALLRALGVTRRTVLATLLAEGALLGAAGATLGIVAGLLLAREALALTGADLGAGYFRALHADLVADPLTLTLYFALGVVTAMLGAAVPAWEAAQRPPAQALHAGDAEEHRPGVIGLISGLLALAGGFTLVQAPPVSGLPLAGYAAIALLLLGAVLLMPRGVSALLTRLPRPAAVVPALGMAQLQGTPRHTAISMAAILVSLSLVAAMLIMVTSFRSSLGVWLDRVLPADLYVRAASSGETAYLNADLQQRIAAIPGVAGVEFVRFGQLLLDPQKAPVTLLARDLPDEGVPRMLHLVQPPQLPDSGQPAAVWISEIAADLYGWQIGQLLLLPLGGRQHTFTIAGIWRDYARQNGSVLINRVQYAALTGDHTANDAAIRLQAGVALSDVERAVRQALGPGNSAEIATAGDIRRRSLGLFDRTFAITWALEVAALIVGLFGVSVAFSAQAIARRREFGVLRHLGMTRRAIGVMLATEGALTAGMGAACGLLAGTVIGLILIRVINQQSFHWSMDLDMPWLALLVLAATIMVCAAGTAVLSARVAMRPDAIHAVCEDW